MPVGGWPPGGHCCGYLINSVGGADNATNTNRHARAEANQLALMPGINGRQARAAAQEAYFRSGGKISLPSAVATNYLVQVFGNPVNIRTGAGTNHNAVGQVRPQRQLRIVAEQVGQDNGSTTLWGQISNDAEFNGMWIALRLTQRIAEPMIIDPPVSPSNNVHMVQPGEWLMKIGNDLRMNWQDIASLNGISEPFIIYPGQRLMLP